MPLSLNPGTFSVVDAYEQEQGTTRPRLASMDWCTRRLRCVASWSQTTSRGLRICRLKASRNPTTCAARIEPA
jgi:hypothetical protein